MNKTLKQLENIFMLPVLFLYVIILIFGFGISLLYAPYGYEFNSTDYIKTTFLAAHIFFILLSIIKWRFQKLVLSINLFFYSCIIIYLIWLLRENDINIYIYFFITLWLILFLFTNQKIGFLTNNRKD